MVVEKFLEGSELSLMAICDGRTAWPLAPAQDFKRVGNGDTGPNTGGMGAFSPVPAASVEASVVSSVVSSVMAEAVQPTLDALSSRGIDYRGVLYAGLMLTPDGPRVLEFNVPLRRFWGGRSCCPAGRRMWPPFWPRRGRGGWRTCPRPRSRPEPTVCVVLAAPGYPSDPVVGAPISGLIAAAAQPGVQVYCAGVGVGRTGLTTAGGRVLGVGATGADVESARRRVYSAVPAISWPGLHYRTDIAAAHAQQLT